MADEGVTFYLEGKAYELDDFELGELEWLEDELGDLDDGATLKSMKAAVRFVTVIKRRELPDFSVEDARKLKLTIFDAPAQNGNGNGARPTKAAKAARSTRAASGANS